MGIRGTARLLVEKAFVQRFVETLSGSDKRSDVVSEFIADEQLRRHIAAIEAAFPRFDISLDDIVGEGDKVVIRGIMQGVHRAEVMGIAPTHKRATMPFIAILRISGGKIVECWPSSDLYGVLQQLNPLVDENSRGENPMPASG